MDQELPRGRGGISALLPDSGNPGCGWRSEDLETPRKQQTRGFLPETFRAYSVPLNNQYHASDLSRNSEYRSNTDAQPVFTRILPCRTMCQINRWVHTVPHKVGTTISPTTTKLEKDGRKLRPVGSSGIDDGAISRALLYIHPAGTCWYLLGEFHICASVLPKPPSCQSRRFNTRLSMPLSRAVRVMRREFPFTNSWALNMPVCRHVLRGPLRSMILLAPSWMLRDMGKYMP